MAERVERQEEIVPALTEAAKSSHVPCVIEFVIDSRWKVLPIVPSGKPCWKWFSSEVAENLSKISGNSVKCMQYILCSKEK